MRQINFLLLNYGMGVKGEVVYMYSNKLMQIVLDWFALTR